MKKSHLLGLILVTILIGSALNIRAAQPTPEPSPPRALLVESQEAPFFGSGSRQVESRQPAETTDLVPWSKLVFESYRDGNWEIYLANGDGSAQTRLTRDGALDVYPRLNRGCTRIAFSSFRTGNYEIFTMNPDGSGLTQLTFHAATDYDPVWSPDGSKIAFHSYRDGQAEVYVMNADGSGLARLTWDAAYDGEPDWSPDGSRIAFRSDRGGGERIWVMNADGSGQAPLSSPIIYTQNPIWSPDGSQIAFDADGDNDGWNEVFLMNADGSNQRQVYDAGGQTEAWVRSWSPDGQYVAFSRISWIYYEGDWYWTEAYLDAWDSIGGGTIRLSTQGADWHPGWQTTDAQAPTSKVNALPAYSRSTATISWSGSDTGDAGIKVYDVQYRDAVSGDWTNWQTGTTGTSATFSGIGGHTYYFHSRATDSAYNVEPWPVGNGDTSTTFYNWAVNGTARDNRETPLAGVSVTISPSAFEAGSSNADGHFFARVGTYTDTYAIAWAKSGYDELPVTDFDVSQDAQVGVILPPANNVVQNWGFENGSFGSGGWLASGIVTPVVTDTIKHTGDYAALLGKSFTFAPVFIVSDISGDEGDMVLDMNGFAHIAWTSSSAIGTKVYYARRAPGGPWSSPQSVTTDYDMASELHLAADASGHAHMVWTVHISGDSYIYYAGQTQDSTWSGPQNLSSTSDSSQSPQLAIDGNGVIHVVWEDYSPSQGGIYYAWRGGDGVWSDARRIYDYGGEPQLKVDREGGIHLLWRGGGISYARRAVDGTWSSQETVLTTCDEVHSPSFALDESGVVHIVWDCRFEDIYYTQRSGNGTYSNPQNVSNTSGRSERPQLVVDRARVVHIIWDDGTASPGYNVYYTRRGSEGFWSSPSNISAPCGAGRYAGLVADENNRIHLVLSAEGIFYYTRRESDGAWSAPSSIYAGNMASPRLALDENGNIHMIWVGYVPALSHYGVHYLGPALVEQTGNSLVAQTVVIPITMSNPTLSLFYQLGGAPAASNSWFDIQIGSDVTNTTLYSTTTDTEAWTHRWFDLTPWNGQTITLSFNARQTAGKPYVWAYLDDVTIGSAYPDLWVTKDSRTPAALPGEPVAYTIAYGNRGGALASGVRITDTLPEEMFFVDAAPRPVFNTLLWAWEWSVEDLPAGGGPFHIVVTATVAPTATLWGNLTSTVRIGTASPELETANNMAPATIFVGRWVFLPLALKEYSE